MEFIEFMKCFHPAQENYFIIHNAKRAYSTRNGMIRHYIDLAKLDNKEYKLNMEDGTITNLKTGKKLYEQHCNLTPETKPGKLKRGRKPKK